jgi:hypothetical protein
MLSFIDERAWKDIHGFKKLGPFKDPTVYAKPPNGVPGLLSQCQDEPHARMRKVFTGAFSDRALKEQEPLFLQYIDMLVKKLKGSIKENPNCEIDMVRMLSMWADGIFPNQNLLIMCQTSQLLISWEISPSANL